MRDINRRDRLIKPLFNHMPFTECLLLPPGWEISFWSDQDLLFPISSENWHWLSYGPGGIVSCYFLLCKRFLALIGQEWSWEWLPPMPWLNIRARIEPIPTRCWITCPTQYKSPAHDTALSEIAFTGRHTEIVFGPHCQGRCGDILLSCRL